MLPSLDEIAYELASDAARSLRDEMVQFEWERSTVADLMDYYAARTHSDEVDSTGESQRLVAQFLNLERRMDKLKRDLANVMTRHKDDAAYIEKCHVAWREKVTEALDQKQKLLDEWKPPFGMLLKEC